MCWKVHGFFGLEEEACMIEQAVKQVLQDGTATRDIWEEGKTLLSTNCMGARIAERIIQMK